MFRYFGYLLIAIMALVLAGGVGLVVFGVLADRAATQGRVRLVAFDGVGPAVGPAGQGGLEVGFIIGIVFLVVPPYSQKKFVRIWNEEFPWEGFARRKMLPELPSFLQATNPII